MLNSLCEKVAEMSDFQRKTLAAAVRYAQPQGVYQVNRVAEELSQFEFTPGVSTPEEYGRSPTTTHSSEAGSSLNKSRYFKLRGGKENEIRHDDYQERRYYPARGV